MRKRRFRGQGKHRRYVENLMKVSSMPNIEKKKWDNLMPHMSSDELYRLQEVLEAELSQLAGLYLDVMKRRASESRTPDVRTEVPSDKVKSFTQKRTGSEMPEIRDLLERDYSNEEHDVDKRKIRKEIDYLERLVRNANFFTDNEKQTMIESIKNMPLFAIKQLKNAIIRQALKNLKQKKIAGSVLS